MKLLYYSTSYHASHGGSIQAIEFYKNLDGLGLVEEKQLFPEKGKPAASSGDSKNSIRKTLKNSSLLQVFFFFRRNRFYLKKLEDLIKQNSPDVILLQIDSNFLQINKLKKQFPNLLVCCQINGSPFDEPFKNVAFKQYFLKEQQNAYASADLNFFISSFLRNRIMDGKLDHERDKVVQNGTDVTRFHPLNNKSDLRQRFNYPDNKIVVGYIGTLDIHKKMDLLVKVFQKLLPLYPNLYLVIIGEGPGSENLRQNITDLQLEKDVELKGWIAHNKINEHLNCFDIAIHHHANDYMSPLKLFEYLAAGVPVIGPDIPSVREIFTDREHLLLTKPTEEDIARNLIEVLQDPSNAKKRSMTGRAYVKENFTWAQYTEKIADYIQEKKKERS